MFGLLIPAATAAEAQTATLTISGNPGPLQINTAVPGSAPTSVSEATTTYDLSTTYSTVRITARVSAAVPAGTSLQLTLQAPPGGTALGPLALTMSDQDLVTGVPTGNYTALTITYQLTATSAAGVISTTSPTVTLTVIP